MRRGLGVLVVVVAFLIGTTAPAWAVIADSNFKFHSIVAYGIGTGIDRITGGIKSEKPAKCLPNRSVTINRLTSSGPVLFGSGVTNSSGQFDISGNNSDGRYSFNLTAVRVGNVTCTHDFIKGRF